MKGWCCLTITILSLIFVMTSHHKVFFISPTPNLVTCQFPPKAQFSSSMWQVPCRRMKDNICLFQDTLSQKSTSVQIASCPLQHKWLYRHPWFANVAGIDKRDNMLSFPSRVQQVLLHCPLPMDGCGIAGNLWSPDNSSLQHHQAATADPLSKTFNPHLLSCINEIHVSCSG